MLTIKQITENTDAVLRGLEKKHFKNAKETIAQVLDFNDKRKANQTILDKNLAEANSLSKSIGQLMKEGKKEEAEAAKSRVAELKEVNKDLQANMDQAANDLQTLLYTIPNVPYDSVPEGVGADDNVVEKIGGMETELPKDALPHWELAKKYDLIDFDLGVKITGAGFPVYKGKGAQLQRALINFFLDEARKSGYTEIMPPTVVNAASGYGTGQLPYEADAAGAPQNTIADGPALWASAGKKPAEYKAVARFVSFWLQPDNQVAWQRETGYLPLNRAGLLASRSELLGNDLENIQVAVDQLGGKPATPQSSAQPVVEREKVRRILDEELAGVWADQKAAKEALDNAVTRARNGN